MIAALAEVFEFREDWHRQDRALPLVRQYEQELTSLLETHGALRDRLVCCCHCGLAFLTQPCNRGRRDLRCPFGCRAHYRVFDLATIRRIAWLLVDPCADTTPREIEIDNDYQRRPSYAEGSLTDEPDLTTYDRLWEETDHDHEKQEEPQQKEHDDDPQI